MLRFRWIENKTTNKTDFQKKERKKYKEMYQLSFSAHLLTKTAQ